MKLKLKLRAIGTSLGVIIPRKIIKHYNINDEVELDIIIKDENIIMKKPEETKNIIISEPVITLEEQKEIKPVKKIILKEIKKSGQYEFCPIHPFVMKINCPCNKKQYGKQN